MSAIHDEAFKEFESLGEAEVRRLLATNGIHITKQEPARLWLTLKEAEAKARADNRSEESLSIARQALTNSKFATKIAICAVVLSVAMVILKFIEWHAK